MKIKKANCFEIALGNANIIIPPDLSIPKWIAIEEIPSVCEKLNLLWIGDGEVQLGGQEPVIVIYRTGAGTGHAVFTSDISLLPVDNIIGLIRLKE